MNKSKIDEPKKTDEISEQHLKEFGKTYWVIFQCEKDDASCDYVRELEGKYYNCKAAMNAATSKSISVKLDEYCKNQGYMSASIKDVISDEDLHKNQPRLVKI